LRNILFTILIVASSCQGEQNHPISPAAKPTVLTIDQIVKRNYDIPELQNFKDQSKYIALFTIQRRYNNYIIIEFSEITNGINLCVKQPVIESDYQTYDSVRSLPFNQLCYWYADEEARKVKELFKNYDTGEVVRDIQCESCLDPEIWTLEIYNHGKYSSVTKDAYGKYEPFIDSLFEKAHLNKKNNYRITH